MSAPYPDGLGFPAKPPRNEREAYADMCCNGNCLQGHACPRYRIRNEASWRLSDAVIGAIFVGVCVAFATGVFG